MKKIEDKLLSVSNERLITKMEEERALLDSFQEDIQRKMKNRKSNEDNFGKLLAQTEPMFVQPLKMWKNSNFEIRQLLTKVRFGGVLYYKKNQGYRTNETPDVYTLFALKKYLDSRLVRQGGVDPNPIRLSNKDFDVCF